MPLVKIAFLKNSAVFGAAEIPSTRIGRAPEGEVRPTSEVLDVCLERTWNVYT